MQKISLNTSVASRVLPVALSLLLGVAATGLAVSATPKSAAPATHKEFVKSKTTPAKATPAKTDKKDDASKTSKDGKPTAKEKEATAKEIDAAVASATPVESLALMKEPTNYLNKKVTFTGTFNRFADIALDYKKAFRDSRDYVTFFILRPDVTDHTIPLAELKLFFPRKRSSEVLDLEPGDKIQLVGTEFSTALDEPWVDVEHIKIIEKTEKHEKKHTPEF